MIDRFFIEALYQMETAVRIDEALSKHTTFGIGGCVPLYVKPLTLRTLPEIIPILMENGRDLKILGIGSNVLAEEGLLPFTVLDMTDINGFCLEEKGIWVEAGCALRKMSRVFFDHEWSGLEFAAGIPGTIGGGIVMNAGAYGSQMADLVLEVEAFDRESGGFRVYSPQACRFSYRSSRFSQTNELITRVLLKTRSGDVGQIGEEMKDFERRRIEKQPLEYGSAGSIFKKPSEDFHVGKAIEELGLKGRRIGGARISPRHCGFIVNEGSASYADVRSLIDLIRNEISRTFGIGLELEVCLWGR